MDVECSQYTTCVSLSVHVLVHTHTLISLSDVEDELISAMIESELKTAVTPLHFVCDPLPKLSRERFQKVVCGIYMQEVYNSI